MSELEFAFYERFLPEPNTGCWLWIGNIDTGTGYGRLWAPGRRSLLAHRFSYTLHIRQIPRGLQLDHLCRVRSCVSPQHLEPVTIQENLRRGLGTTAATAARVKNALAKTHCKTGHLYSDTNTFIANDGSRGCRQCHRESQARYCERKAIA